MAAASALVAFPAYAQAPYPAKPIRMIVPFPAGGGYDFLGRLYAAKMSETWGQAVLVENRAGANGNIGSEVAAKAPPDGYTLLMGGIGPQALSVGLYPALPYDPLKAFEPISLVAGQPNLLVVHPSMPVKTLKDFIALAKAKPRQINYSSSGNGSAPHLQMALLISMAGIDITHVPYKGGAPQVAALLGGETQASFATIGTVISQIQAGKLRPLGVGSSARAKALPGVPTISEAGLPGYDMNPWIGVFAPAGTPRAIIDRLNAEMNQALSIPEVMSTLAKQALDPAPTTVDEFNRILRVDFEKYGKLIALTGAKIE